MSNYRRKQYTDLTVRKIEPTEYRVAGEVTTFENWRNNTFKTLYKADLIRQADNCRTLCEELGDILDMAEWVNTKVMSDRLRLIEEELMSAVSRGVEQAGLREA